MKQNNELQKEAIRVLGMETQLLHAVEELTELSLEIQRVVRFFRENQQFATPGLPLIEEFCDARNALATVEIFLLEHFSPDRIAQSQKNKDAKFAQIIQEAQRQEDDHKKHEKLNDSLCCLPGGVVKKHQFTGDTSLEVAP